MKVTNERYATYMHVPPCRRFFSFCFFDKYLKLKHHEIVSALFFILRAPSTYDEVLQFTYGEAIEIDDSNEVLKLFCLFFDGIPEHYTFLKIIVWCREDGTI